MTRVALGRLSLIACMVLWTSCTLDSSTPVSEAYDLAIVKVTTIDADRGARPNQTVLIKNGKIAAVQPSSKSGEAYRAAVTVDGTGRFLIPGLWDMHVHVTYEPALTASMADLFLDYGITSVRDTGGLLHNIVPEVQRWRAAETVAPRIYFSGPLLDGSKVVYDGDGRPEIGVANATATAATARVQQLIAAGVDFIKIYELVSPEVFRAFVDAATQNNLPIAAHVPLSLMATQAGPQVGSMEHLRNVELACSNKADALLTQRQQLLSAPGELSGYELRSKLHSDQRPQALADMDLNSERCQTVIQSLRTTIQVPTIRLNTIFANSPLDRDDWLAAISTMPGTLAKQWEDTARYFAARPAPNLVAFSQWSMDLVRAMNKAGVPIGAGTDTPIGQALPGYSLHTELERLVEAGLSPLQALAAATVRPAEFLNIADVTGLIRSGMTADLVLLTANPLNDITNTRSISHVVLGGRVVRQ